MVRIHRRREDVQERIAILLCVQEAMASGLFRIHKARALDVPSMGQYDLNLLRQRALLLRKICFDRSHFHSVMRNIREVAKLDFDDFERRRKQYV